MLALVALGSEVALFFAGLAVYLRVTKRCWNCRKRLWRSALVCSNCARRQQGEHEAR